MELSAEIAAEKPRIFVSYARSDSSALAEELALGLGVGGSSLISIGTTSPPRRTGRRGSAG
jgi:hypothetical protein